MQPVDAATMKPLDEPNDTHMYVNELMKTKIEIRMTKASGPPEHTGQEDDYTPIKRRNLKEKRELMKKEKLDPSKDA